MNEFEIIRGYESLIMELKLQNAVLRAERNEARNNLILITSSIQVVAIKPESMINPCLCPECNNWFDRKPNGRSHTCKLCKVKKRLEYRREHYERHD